LLAIPDHLAPPTVAWVASVQDAYVLEEHHVRLLLLAASAWDEAEAARETIAAEGAIYRDRFGAPRPHPAVKIEHDARIAFARLVRELDLDDETAPCDSRPPRIGR
jgi:hypothetical protein